MTRNRVEALRNRVARLRRVTDYLETEHASVDTRIQAIEAAVDDQHLTESRSTSTSTSVSSGFNARDNTHSEASDEEVAVAIQSIDTSSNETATEESTDDIIVV